MYKIDYEKILTETGYNLQGDDNALYIINTLIDALESHNKNYNKEQYDKICTLQSIFHNIKVAE